MRADIKAELAKDAGELLADFGRTVTFKARVDKGETSGTTLSVTAMVGDPSLQQSLVPGGFADSISFEVKVPATTALPASWNDFGADAWMGRKAIVQGYAKDLKVSAITSKQDAAWVILKLEAYNG